MILDGEKISVAPHTRAEINPYETCPSCDGCGLGLNAYTGEPDNCWTCHGYGTIRARDERGRFIGNTSSPRVKP